ncbi:3-oxoacyl-[acyl-carrier-protein] synthase III [Candidatus Kuenenia stuttgartiensis]|uniref:Beta-ketoacyl-[acyl-carrier-protein] synthase III n=1 Tax=Kuenenia stuttgartiensis TaxID=174633 RepID=A0A2C9CDL0_KUEST|nr:MULTISPECIES: beta-ketoacyl-ACP synthase III [Kuenenia]MBE7547566.1 ketoacyl-ACP synthase III [Planctomycetia bacterium]MBW7941064.1 ketoacyl-ACP synthase III [Candidatus Kuenenia stuttgartiensis]MCF6152116.1 ketoacyl-ACP synthase III [Candidatus Kuenenia stuttgartiensis]QII10508.1 3-oxoacyl-[acyl-carrier-protein] synthase III [Candidatus Kuenenia stuttgartiensis]TVM02459.1 MAG: ketoacyl-ACP synthase III [Candidatus Kuenenia stuttgartiensis]
MNVRQNQITSITGIGSYLPEKILTNHALEKLVDTTDDWILQRTGIRERRIVENGVTTSDLGAIASLKAIENAGISAEEIDMIITSTITPDYLFPSTSCCLQKQIGAVHASAFDISAACAGFVYALSIGQSVINSGAAKTVLVVGAECLSKITDYTDRATCILFGDGAGAVILQNNKEKHQILDTRLVSDGTYTDVLIIPGGGSKHPATIESVQERLHYIRFKGREVFKLAINTITNLVIETAQRNGFAVQDIDLIIPHQSNLRIIEATMERLKLPMEKAFVNIDKYGNTSSASVPIAIDEAQQEGRLKKGDLVMLVAFGGGLTWGSCVVRW